MSLSANGAHEISRAHKINSDYQLYDNKENTKPQWSPFGLFDDAKKIPEAAQYNVGGAYMS